MDTQRTHMLAWRMRLRKSNRRVKWERPSGESEPLIVVSIPKSSFATLPPSGRGLSR